MEKEIIIYYLSTPNLEKQLWDQGRNLRKSLLELQKEEEQVNDEIMYTLQISMNMSDMPTSKTNNISDLDDILNKTKQQIRGYYKSTILEYSSILKKMDEYKRVHLVFGTLFPFERDLIQRLYIDNQTWEAVEIDTGINHRILVSKINDIFDVMSEKIESNLSNVELARQENNYRLLKLNPKKKKKTGEIKGQTNVYDFFVKEEQKDAEEE